MVHTFRLLTNCGSGMKILLWKKKLLCIVSTLKRVVHTRKEASMTAYVLTKMTLQTSNEKI
jgi:hypothetical protein